MEFYTLFELWWGTQVFGSQEGDQGLVFGSWRNGFSFYGDGFKAKVLEYYFGWTLAGLDGRPVGRGWGWRFSIFGIWKRRQVHVMISLYTQIFSVGLSWIAKLL